MTKHRLQIDDEFDFLAFGLSCHQKDYRVAWLLNTALHRKFVRDTVQLTPTGGAADLFAKYTALDEDNRLSYTLLTNHNESAFLIKQYKQYDYFILIEGYIDIFDTSRFLETLQAIDGFQYAAEMDTEPFERFQYALFE